MLTSKRDESRDSDQVRRYNIELMTDEDEDRRNRAEERRKTIKVRFTTLDDETDPWPTFGAEAVFLAARITRELWAISGREVPSYERSEIPLRFVPFDRE